MVRSNHFSREAILRDLLKILGEMTSDWEGGFAGAIGPETRLAADLALESIHVVQLVVAIERHFQRQDLPFQQLFVPGDRSVDDLRVSDLVDFLYTHLNTPSSGRTDTRSI
ncbi:MAG: acyl carrier protein [Nitrospinota bacterium]|nr:MAG: acyl carrier protein [Nitrospinota bacterium]